MRWKYSLCLGLCMVLAAWLSSPLWTSPPRSPDTIAPYRSTWIQGIPHVKQKPDFCGEACAEMYLRKLKKDLDQDFVFDQSGLDPALGRGCYTKELQTALGRIGFQVGTTWYQVSAEKREQELEQQFAALHKDLAAGVPSIVCMHYDDSPRTTEHFRLIVGYDADTDEVIYHEPAQDDAAYRRMPRRQLLKLWPLKYEKQSWTVIRMPLRVSQFTSARTVSEEQTDAEQTDADYAQHVMKLKQRLPEGFHVVIEKPFVVIGDEAPEVVQRRATGTVRWAVDRLKAVYFSKDPDEILDIWLFKDKESYTKHTQDIFGDRPTTPFGYYSPRHRALIMNISTGGGTLVHEIVHPFVRANFADCPAWFNEGLGSLYEQCGDRNGRITGFTNWRLKGLQKAIADRRVPPFKTLCSTTTNEFYERDKGTNYAQARYLCYYLQEHGLLAKYYHQFRKEAENDATGYESLGKVLGETDMLAFQRRWEAWVMDLRF